MIVFIAISFLIMGLMGGFVLGVLFSLNTMEREREKERI